MLTHAAPRLEQFGDLEFVTSGIDLLVRQGNGASAQRKALGRGTGPLADLYLSSLDAGTRGTE